MRRPRRGRPRHARNAKNNHGTCGTLQAVCFARLVGDRAVLAECRQRLTAVPLPSELATDGSFPQELARPKADGDSLFYLDVMTGLAAALSSKDDNLLPFALADGRRLVPGVAGLAPCVADHAAWLNHVRKPATATAAQADSPDPIKPAVMEWNDWPVRRPLLIFGALAGPPAGRATWLATWEN